MLFRDHFLNGTRPNGIPGKPGRRWTRLEFASQAKVSMSAVVKWLAGKARPTDFPSVEAAFFGGNPAYEAARLELRRAYDRVPDRRKRPVSSKAVIEIPLEGLVGIWVPGREPIAFRRSDEGGPVSDHDKTSEDDVDL